MKIRESFVSNSSTTSFLVYGINTDIDYLMELAQIKGEIEGKEFDPEDKYDLADEFCELLTKNSPYSFEFHFPYDDDDIIMGVSWCGMREDDTKRMFKENVENAFVKFLSIPKEQIDTWEGAYDS